jgi:hypothetical protein
VKIRNAEEKSMKNNQFLAGEAPGWCVALSRFSAEALTRVFCYARERHQVRTKVCPLAAHRHFFPTLTATGDFVVKT